MPPRQSDQRREHLGDNVRDASARLESLRTEVSKGSGALRNRARQTMVLSPSSQVPLLEPRQNGEPIGTALRWGATGVEFIDSTDDGGYRDVSMRGVDARGQVRGESFAVSGNAIFCPERDGAIRWAVDGALEIANGDGATLKGIRSSRIHANELVSNGGIAAGTGMSADVYRVDGNSIFSRDRDNAVRWSNDTAFESCNRSGSQFRGVRCSQVAEVGATSWSWSKTGHQTIDEALGMTPGELFDQVAARVTSWRHDPDVVPDVATGERRVGLMLDDLPEILVDRNIIPERVETTVEVEVTDDNGEPTGETVTETSSVETGVMLDRSTWDVRGVVSALVVEVASLRARLAALEATT